MKLHSFHDLFLMTLSDVYLMEKQIASCLNWIINKVSSRDLRNLVEEHQRYINEQIKKLEVVFHNLNERPLPCEWENTLKGAFFEGEKILNENDSSPLLDSSIIIALQKMCHYKMACYGSLKEFADVLEYDHVKTAFKSSVKEIMSFDRELNKLAKGGIFTASINLIAAGRK